MSGPWRLLDLIREAARYLSGKGVASPRLDAEVLMAHVLGCRRIDLYLRHDQPLSAEEVDRFRVVLRRRSRREPVAYITGSREFCSFSFRVTPAVLIPRPETELLVEVALAFINEEARGGGRPMRVLEIGTGSGAVALTLALTAGDGIEVWATDRSGAALDVARENARQLGVQGRVCFLQGNLFEPLGRDLCPFSLIVSNPPYVSVRGMMGLEPEVRDHEPREALDGGEDGLAVIRPLIRTALPWLRQGGLLLVEVGGDQRAAVEALLAEPPQWGVWEWHRDLAGRDRVLALRPCAQASPVAQGSG